MLIIQIKGYKMSILKHLKNNKFTSDDSQDVHIKIEDSKLYAISLQREPGKEG